MPVKARPRLFAPFGLFVPLLRPAPLPESADKSARASPGTVRSALRYSVAEGALAEAFTACTSNAMLTAWALALDCKPLLFGVLWALPYLAQVVQFPAAWLSSRLGGRKTAIAAIAIARQLQLPLAVLPLLAVSLGAKQAVFTAVTALAALLGVVGNNGWTTWMGELVPSRLRGRYFGRRTAVCTLAGTIAALGAGVWIDAARRHGLEREGLCCMAALACGIGALTSLLMRRQCEAPAAEPQPAPCWSTLLEPWRDGAVRSALWFNLAWNAAVGLAASFFLLHMAENLGMGFLAISIYCAAVAVVRMLTSTAWGAAIDRVGCKPVILCCTVGIAAIPALWTFAGPHHLWPVALDVLLGGALWAGFNQATFQLPLRISPRRNRAFHLAAFSTAGGLAFALASAVGGAFAQALPAHFLLRGHVWTGFEVLFILSTVARLGAVALAVRLVEPGAQRVRNLWPAAGAPLQLAAQGAGIGESAPARIEK